MIMRWLVVAVVIGGWLAEARADDFFKSSPGDLTASHATIDSKDKCTTCHEADGTISAAKCVGCHEHADLKRKIDKNEGLHASAKVRGTQCKFCHQEHRGRGFDLMGWPALGGPANFDHKLTGWALAGKHATTKCEGCHKTTNKQGLRTYLGTESNCTTCHAKDQSHWTGKQAVMRCDRCHTDKIWRPRKATLDFNHNDRQQAAMPLEGAHADVTCVRCHPKAVFKVAAFDGGCAQCHKSPHDGQLFSTKKCETCHSPQLKSLKQVNFDHKKDAGYALLGKHAKLACGTCHTKALAQRKPSPGCETCHAKDSKHGKRFAAFTACATCHTQKQWKGSIQFAHEQTPFALTGKHAQAKCRDCHRGKTPADFERFEIKNGCMSCHQHKVAHGGQFKNNECLTCHQEAGVKRPRVDTLDRFHGDASSFPLRNGHAKVQCQLCHANDVFKGTPKECGEGCHADSLHKGSLGAECSRCHEPGQWPAVRFDHTQDTKWSLKGKHAEIDTCESCHPTRSYKGAPTSCSDASCHQRDDVHTGKLGKACERCHTETGQNLFDHGRDAQFKIDGKHAPLVCASCHKSVAFKPLRNDCVGCHAEPAIHKGRYGTTCERCHSTQSFSDIKAQHDVGDFSLTGAHDQLACARCHPNGEKRRGSGNLCVTCHKKDDIHNNALSPRCGECHTQRAFSPARFTHASTGCSLMGLHATLPCADCHRNGNYGAVSPLCVSCHRNDALRVRTLDHRALIECGTCHNPQAWVPATGTGQQSICR